MSTTAEPAVCVCVSACVRACVCVVQRASKIALR